MRRDHTSERDSGDVLVFKYGSTGSVKHSLDKEEVAESNDVFVRYFNEIFSDS